MNVTAHPSIPISWHRHLLIAWVVFWCLPVFGQTESVATFVDDTTFSRQSLFTISQTDPLYTAMVLPSMTPEWHSMFTNIPSDLKIFGESMVEKRNLPLLSGVILATIGLHAVDKQIWNITKRDIEKYRSPSSFNNYLVGIGNGGSHFGVAGAFAVYGALFDDHRALRTASQSVEAILVTGLVVQVLKRIAGRESPAAADLPNGVWRPFPNLQAYERHQSKYYAFPSGHTASTTALITVIAQNYPECKWLKPVGLVLIGLVEVGLVNSGMHWSSDFPLALMLGYTCGMIVSNRGISSEKGIPIDHSSGITFKPVLTPVGAEVGMSLCF